MTKRVEILSEKRVFDQHFKIDEAKVRFERFNGGMSHTLTRLNFNRGDSAAVILHDPQADTVILTEQFRYPTHTKGQSWILEVPAGSVEASEENDPTKTLQRELMEEIGYAVQTFEKAATFFVSPGGSSERIHLYYATVTASDKVAAGGGVAREGEDIRMVTMGVRTALEKISSGEIMDAKTIIGLQWLALHKAKVTPDK